MNLIGGGGVAVYHGDSTAQASGILPAPSFGFSTAREQRNSFWLRLCPIKLNRRAVALQLKWKSEPIGARRELARTV